jgi:hypothetical protein
MKVLLMLMIAVITVIGAGCSGASITPANSTTAEQLAVSIAARTLGYKIAEADPAIISSAKIYCQALSSGNINQAMVDSVRAFLTEKFKDPLLAASVTDLFAMVKVNDVYAPDLVKTAAAAALEGIALYERWGARPSAPTTQSKG